MSINIVSLTGNLGSDAELRTTQAGTPVLSFSLGVSDRVKKGDDWGEHTNWISCVLFGNRATGIAKHLTKGTKVAVYGKLRTSSYEKDGQRRKSWEVRVEDIEFMSSRSSSQQGEAPKKERSAKDGGTSTYDEPSVYDEDIPF